MSSQPSSPAASPRRWSRSAPSPSRVYALRGAGDDAHALSPVRPPSASQSDQSRCSSPGLTHSMPVFSVMAMSTGGLNTVQSAPATPLSRSSLRMLTDRAPSRMHNSASSLYQLAGLQRQVCKFIIWSIGVSCPSSGSPTSDLLSPQTLASVRSCPCSKYWKLRATQAIIVPVAPEHFRRSRMCGGTGAPHIQRRTSRCAPCAVALTRNKP